VRTLAHAARLIRDARQLGQYGIVVNEPMLGGENRRLPVPGFELTSTHSDAWSLTSVPPSMLVIGAGATGVQVASIFNAFGSRIQLFEAGPRILPSEDEDVSAAVAEAFRGSCPIGWCNSGEAVVIAGGFGRAVRLPRRAA
jgi:pyruvate/2-oxoglutarate dehydrogenase complex dihydrolipoamide dehydrogenase (E3) component